MCTSTIFTVGNYVRKVINKNAKFESILNNHNGEACAPVLRYPFVFDYRFFIFPSFLSLIEYFFKHRNYRKLNFTYTLFTRFVMFA